ncbi:hypothetical protein ABIB60_002958 [Hymenobacter sp. UYP22]
MFFPFDTDRQPRQASSAANSQPDDQHHHPDV